MYWVEDMRYYKACEEYDEKVEIDLLDDRLFYMTTCVVDIIELERGLINAPCGNGTDLEINPELRDYILSFVKMNRKDDLRQRNTEV